MGDHLTALDATFLELEQADESAHMHIGGSSSSTPPSGGAPSLEELCAHLGGRLAQPAALLPAALTAPHRRPIVAGVARPIRRSSSRATSRRAALPAPGGERELADWAAGFFSQRLDRHRPLWEMVIVEGLQDGRWALATKTHHCMVDGVGSMDVGHLILDARASRPRAAAGGSPRRTRGAAGGRRRDARTGAQRSASPEPEPGALARLARAWAGLLPVESLSAAAQMGVHGALHPREALSSTRARPWR